MRINGCKILILLEKNTLNHKVNDDLASNWMD